MLYQCFIIHTHDLISMFYHLISMFYHLINVIYQCYFINHDDLVMIML